MGSPRLGHWLMISPVQLLLAGFIMLPALWVAWLSLNQSTFGQAPVFIGLDNFREILGDDVFWRAAWNTFVVVNIVVYGELLLGIGLAFLMAGWMPGRTLMIACFLAPYAVSEVTAVVMWRYMLEPDVGMINWALLRIGLGLWWLESWRHKDRKGWFERGTGIAWAADVANRHQWPFVKTGFAAVVQPRPKLMAYVVVYAELALGLGLVLGFLTPIALVGGLLLNLLYLVLMIHDWAEQGQNSMMALISLVALFAMSWQTWSLDSAIGLFT